jgi:hypothetical protein
MEAEDDLKRISDEIKQFEAWKLAQKQINKVELKTEKIEKVEKPKKERTEKQKEATARMREALLTRRKDHNDKKTEHTEEYQKKIEETKEKAHKLKQAYPDLNVVVKSSVGRPKGVKNPPVDPTPYISDEEDAPVKSVVNKPLPTKPIKKLVNHSLATVNQDLMSAYLSRLNNF